MVYNVRSVFELRRGMRVDRLIGGVEEEEERAAASSSQWPQSCRWDKQ